jgi:hypothetical protein
VVIGEWIGVFQTALPVLLGLQNRLARDIIRRHSYCNPQNFHAARARVVGGGDFLDAVGIWDDVAPNGKRTGE